MASIRFGYEEKIREKDCVIQELTNRLAHDEALLGRNSTNIGLPTGMTLPGKKKHNPNSRENSGKKKGGQPGHNRVLHRYWLYECADCGETVRCSIDPGLRADCQYGLKIQAFALSLMNTANAPRYL